MSATNLSSTAHNEVLQAMDDFKLPQRFYRTVEEFYLPIAASIAASTAPSPSIDRSLTVFGIQGSQGSGKSTCAAFLKILLEQEFDRRTLVVSIDDFYLTREQRVALAEQVHPLFATRGVPATHDIGLIMSMLEDARAGKVLKVPVFDKSRDDRAAVNEWQCVDDKLDVIIFEGWCVGLTAQNDTELALPVNDLERNEDSKLVWRRHVNEALRGEYAQLFAQLDSLLALQAPSFECVFGWRLLQEQKMIARLEEQDGDTLKALGDTSRSLDDTSRALNEAQLTRFISHYQRLTEHALKTMPDQADYLLALNSDHSFDELRIKNESVI